MAVVFVVLLLLDFLGFLRNPYLGLLLFVAVPAAFLVGLLLIPIGMRLDSRRRRRTPGADAVDWPVLDFGVKRQRTIALVVLVLTSVNLVLLSMASYGAVHYMETTEFCGTVCHTTMEPHYVRHQNGPHARVRCVDCHVGGGVGALVTSKMAGTRQLWHVVTNDVTTPVPSPVRNMRPARFTCENCHWPEAMHGDRVKVVKEYANDEQNSETVSTLTLLVGGGSRELGIGRGIHWHMDLDNEIEYVTTDAKRAVIPYIRLRSRDGAIREYRAPGTTEGQLARGERRRMDCIDCHNRPAHTFDATAERAVNRAIADGRLPRELPYVRREAVAALTTDYPDAQTGIAAIATRLRERYTRDGSFDRQLVERAVSATQDLWSRNVFPAMKVTWGTYPNHIGHVDSPGCFRCHDDEHKTEDGRVIRQDCEICHQQS